MKRLVLAATLLVTFAVPASSDAATFFLFDRNAAAPNDRVTVRTGATPAGFRPADRVKPFQRPIRIYLVRNDYAGWVRSRLEPSLTFVGSLVPDRRGRGVLTFSAPPLDAGPYTIAYWCPACAASSRGRTFFVQNAAGFAPRNRAQANLRIGTTDPCPVTLPNGNRPSGQPRSPSWYGNGLLWAGLKPDGVYAVTPDRVGADGSIGDKLLWATTPPTAKPSISGERLDVAAPPLKVLSVNLGGFSGAANPSYMSAVTFPSAGCWRLRARVGDVSLTYVVNVVVR